ncbi:SprT-like domain-containing protein, partial [Novosphingobium sp. KN65.2]|uniref:SprT-like domain-containing protein n=1 Tax=Novosphingobium sp. KN65.2 TaxID=1478134 RepID=UPI0006D55940
MTNPTAQAYAELQLAFDHYNRELFAGELPPCLITMQREKRSYGYFSSERFVHHHDKSKTDEIAINPAYFAVVPLLEVLQTVAHEMVHAWQFHFGNPSRSGYHNREWADKMEAIGLMPSSTGQPGGARTGQKMADYAIPGGPFMLATDALLTQNFRISWVDRFPAIMPTPAIDARPRGPAG